MAEWRVFSVFRRRHNSPTAAHDASYDAVTSSALAACWPGCRGAGRDLDTPHPTTPRTTQPNSRDRSSKTTRQRSLAESKTQQHHTLHPVATQPVRYRYCNAGRYMYYLYFIYVIQSMIGIWYSRNEIPYSYRTGTAQQ